MFSIRFIKRIIITRENEKAFIRGNIKLTEKIIRCAHHVYNTLRFGFLESVYEKCLIIELK